MKPPNRDGGHELLMVLTPVKGGEEHALAAVLEGLRTESPFARLPRTHIGRFMLLPDLPQDPGTTADSLGGPYLLLTSAFDGDAGSYLDELCTEWAAEAPAIWGHCIGYPAGGGPAELKAYLLHNRVDASLFFSAYRQASVAEIRRALDKRERLIAFAVRAQSIDDPAERRRAFLETFA